MNSFENHFYAKYLPEGHELKGIIHKHIFEVFWKLFFWLCIVIFPSFLYYISVRIQIYLPFYVIEIYLLILYLKIIYDIFDWYNDVFIVTDKGIIDFRWGSFKQTVNLIDYGAIEGIEVEQIGALDSLFKKGNLILHKSGDDKTILENAFNPFKGSALIEELSDGVDENEPEKSTEEKFNMLISALGGIMEGYTDKNKSKDEDHTDYIEKYKEKEGTINLRD